MILKSWKGRHKTLNYNLAKHAVMDVYSAPANNIDSPTALIKLNGVLKVELLTERFVPYKTR